MQSEIPNKLYFKIGEVSKLARVAPHVIRYWETEFDGIRPKRANSNQRLYRKVDVELILKIKELLHTRGYTIAGARKLLETGGEQLEVEVNEKALTTASRLKKFKQELIHLREFLQKE